MEIFKGKILIETILTLRSIYKVFDGKTYVFRETIHSLANLLFEERKGLLAGSGMPASTTADQGKDLKEGQTVSPEYAFIWSSSFIKVPWYVISIFVH